MSELDLECLGSVSTEGGPLLLSDLDSVGDWTGSDGGDYDRACRLLDSQAQGGEIMVGRHTGLIWGVPTGTTDIWRLDTAKFVLVRGWLDSDSQADQLRDLALIPRSVSVPLGRLAVLSGWLVIAWATENGAGVARVSPADGLPLDLSVGGSALVARIAAGQYSCSQDEVRKDAATAIRCWIVPIADADPGSEV
jgi:hypothetical protein